MTSEMEMDKKRAILYARVSTNDHGQTVVTQEREMRNYCKENDIEVVAYYFDEQTGTTLIRQGLMAAMMHIRMSDVHIDYLMVYDQSRLTRDEATKDVKKQLEGTGCNIFYVATGKESDDTAAGRIVESITDIMNHEEIRVLRAKTKMGMETRRLQGKHIARPAVFMFAEDVDKAPKGRCILQADDEHKTVTKVLPEKTIFDYARSGYSYYYVARKLIGISPNALYYEMLPTTVPRGKGLKDRYTKYMQLYYEARGISKRVELTKG